jgi:hypothetical protein
MRVTNLTFDFCFRRQGGNGVDDDHVYCTGARQRVTNFQRLLAGVRLRTVWLSARAAPLARVVATNTARAIFFIFRNPSCYFLSVMPDISSKDARDISG